MSSVPPQIFYRKNICYVVYRQNKTPPFGVEFYFGMVFMLRGIERSKCDSPVDCCLMRARPHQHLYKSIPPQLHPPGWFSFMLWNRITESHDQSGSWDSCCENALRKADHKGRAAAGGVGNGHIAAVDSGKLQGHAQSESKVVRVRAAGGATVKAVEDALLLAVIDAGAVVDDQKSAPNPFNL